MDCRAVICYCLLIRHLTHSSQSTAISRLMSWVGRPTAVRISSMVTSPALGILAAPTLASVAVILERRDGKKVYLNHACSNVLQAGRNNQIVILVTILAFSHFHSYAHMAFSNQSINQVQPFHHSLIVQLESSVRHPCNYCAALGLFLPFFPYLHKSKDTLGVFKFCV